MPSRFFSSPPIPLAVWLQSLPPPKPGGHFRYLRVSGKRWRMQYTSGEWPLRQVVSLHRIDDPLVPEAERDNVLCYRAVLACGHRCQLREEDIYRAEVPCLLCAEGQI